MSKRKSRWGGFPDPVPWTLWVSGELCRWRDVRRSWRRFRPRKHVDDVRHPYSAAFPVNVSFLVAYVIYVEWLRPSAAAAAAVRRALLIITDLVTWCTCNFFLPTWAKVYFSALFSDNPRPRKFNISNTWNCNCAYNILLNLTLQQLVALDSETQ